MTARFSATESRPPDLQSTVLRKGRKPLTGRTAKVGARRRMEERRRAALDVLAGSGGFGIVRAQAGGGSDLILNAIISCDRLSRYRGGTHENNERWRRSSLANRAAIRSRCAFGRCGNYLYEEAHIPWSPHKSRHYFRTQLKRWMRENRQYDEEVIDALMGHQPRDAREMYGVIDEDYKKEIVDKVFG